MEPSDIRVLCALYRGGLLAFLDILGLLGWALVARSLLIILISLLRRGCIVVVARLLIRNALSLAVAPNSVAVGHDLRDLLKAIFNLCLLILLLLLRRLSGCQVRVLFVLFALVLRVLLALVVDNDHLHLRALPVLARSGELLDERRSSPVVDFQGARRLPWQMLGEDVFVLVIDLLVREVEAVTVADVNVTGAVIVPVQKEAEAQRGVFVIVVGLHDAGIGCLPKVGVVVGEAAQLRIVEHVDQVLVPVLVVECDRLQLGEAQRLERVPRTTQGFDEHPSAVIRGRAVCFVQREGLRDVILLEKTSKTSLRRKAKKRDLSCRIYHSFSLKTKSEKA